MISVNERTVKMLLKDNLLSRLLPASKRRRSFGYYSLSSLTVFVVVIGFCIISCNSVAADCVCSGVPYECNDTDAPCDIDFGLTCGDDKRCKATTQCSDDTGCSSELMCVGGACANPCKVLPDVCADEGLKNGVCIVRNHRPLCSCPTGSKLNDQKECVTPALVDAMQCEKDGRKLTVGQKVYTQKCGKLCECQADGQLTCRDSEGEPQCAENFIAMSKISGEMSEACKILIGNDDVFDGCCVPKTCQNVTSQDHEESNTKGGRDFKLTESHNTLEDEFEKLKNPSGPSEIEKSDVEKTTMKPNEDASTQQKDVTTGSGEMVDSVEIEDGCMHNGTSYKIGEIFYEGCDQKCECTKTKGVHCIERCSIPLFKKGSFLHDKLCFEEPSGVDECCVIIACARGGPEARELTPTACDMVKCGPNAHCIQPPILNENEYQDNENQTLCVCDGSFLGDPYDIEEGCNKGATQGSSQASLSLSSTASNVKPTVPSSFVANTTIAKPEGCVFNNKTFAFGADHFDGCNYKCHCEASGEFLCRPRCNYRPDEQKDIPKGCEVKKDPKDEECCEMLVCKGENIESTTRKDNPSAPTDGCSYKNKTYARDEQFNDGCEQTCMCYANGDVTCKPRCPPAGVGDDCVMLPDPQDKCCTVTVCGNSTLSDVMKAAMIANKTLMAHPTIEPIVLPNDMRASTTSQSIQLTTSPTGRSFVSPASMSDVKSRTGDVSISAEELSPIVPIIKSGGNKNTFPSSIRITMVAPLNATSVTVSVQIPENELSRLGNQTLTIRYSRDLQQWNSHEVSVKSLFVEGRDELHIVVDGLIPGKEYYFKASVNSTISNTASGFTKSDMKISSDEIDTIGSQEEGHPMSSSEESSGQSAASGEEISCMYKGKEYPYGEDFYDSCDQFCACDLGGKVQCVPIECPTDGLELVDPGCMRWEPASDDFVPEPPTCCPEMKCKQHSSCMLAGGYIISNFDEIPQKITGCDKRCYCQYGNITCENLCPPVSEKPPKGLPCGPEMARLVTMPHNECCLMWTCAGQNRTDGHETIFDHLLIKNLTEQTLDDLLNKTHDIDTNSTMHLHNGTIALPPHHHEQQHNHHSFDASHEHNHEIDQYIPPSTGNQPSIISLDKINPQQLQELLHQLSTLGETETAGGSGEGISHPFVQGTYVQVKNTQEVEELEKSGAKVIDQSADGSYILFIPNAPVPTFNLHGHNGPPYSGGELPFGPPLGGGHPYQRPIADDRVSNILIRPINESTLRIDFTVSPLLVGLSGHVEVLYTKDFRRAPNPDEWQSKVYQQAEDIIDNSHLQLFLTSLDPDTEYHIQIKVIMADIPNKPTSDIIMIRTPPPSLPSTTLPPEILIDPELRLISIGIRTLTVSWRKFTDLENSLIDGVQLTYKGYQDLVYSTTPLIHRFIAEYELTNLQPGKDYEIDLLFIPFESNQTILKSNKPIHISTEKESDDYDFAVIIKSGKISETTAEFAMDGIPHPEDKFVSVYQIIYQTDQQKEQKSTFKVPKRETTKKATITDLKPGTRYTVWLEAFLTNGKKKRSNVIDILTKAGQLPSPEKSEQDKLNESQTGASTPQNTSYYGALVALAIIATLSIIGVIILMLILIKKQNQSKGPISDRKSESSYDNPSFKNYDLESNGHGNNKPGE